MKSAFLTLIMSLPILIFGAAITLNSESPELLGLSFRLPEYSLSETVIEGKKYHQIVCEEGTSLAEEGYPKLLAFSTAIGLPIDGFASVNIISKKSKIGRASCRERVSLNV